MIEDIVKYVKSLMSDKYRVTGYMIGEEEITLLVDEIVVEQEEIPSVIEGKKVYIRKTI